MLEAPHILVGIAIATKIPNPILAIPLAFGSHFVLDMLPHWNPHLNTEMKKYGRISKTTKAIIYGDALVSGAALLFFTSRALPDTMLAITIVLSCVASTLPDLMEAPYFFFKWKNAFLEKWILFQKSIQSDTGFFWGVATQIVTVAAALLSIVA